MYDRVLERVRLGLAFECNTRRWWDNFVIQIWLLTIGLISSAELMNTLVFIAHQGSLPCRLTLDKIVEKNNYLWRWNVYKRHWWQFIIWFCLRQYNLIFRSQVSCFRHQDHVNEVSTYLGEFKIEFDAVHFIQMLELRPLWPVTTYTRDPHTSAPNASHCTVAAVANAKSIYLLVEGHSKCYAKDRSSDNLLWVILSIFYAQN